jgi:hypothetical protein
VIIGLSALELALTHFGAKVNLGRASGPPRRSSAKASGARLRARP